MGRAGARGALRALPVLNNDEKLRSDSGVFASILPGPRTANKAVGDADLNV